MTASNRSISLPLILSHISGTGCMRDCATTQRNHGLAALASFANRCNNEVPDVRTAGGMVHAAAILAY